MIADFQPDFHHRLASRHVLSFSSRPSEHAAIGCSIFTAGLAGFLLRLQAAFG